MISWNGLDLEIER